MHLMYKDDLFYLQCDPDENPMARSAGFRWNSKDRLWVTAFANVAAKVCTTKEMREVVIQKIARERETIAASHATTCDIAVPAPEGLSYLPYQLAGIAFMRDRKNVLLADQMGLGKTIQVIGLCNILAGVIQSALIICPASLKINWMREWQKWTTTNLTVGIADSKCFPDTNVVIINYDILYKLKDRIKNRTWDVLAIDECHYAKNPDAKRTAFIVGKYNKIPPLEAGRIIALTGTPILNKPIEIHTIVRYLNPLGWSTRFEFAKRYCNAFLDSFGWNFNGASRLEELQDRLRSTIMIRRLKKDVLKDLPDKRRQIIEVEPDAQAKRVLKKEQELFADAFNCDGYKEPDQGYLNELDYRDIVRFMQGGSRIAFEDVSRIRHETALCKVGMVIDHLRDVLDSGDKVVCFAHHKDVIALIYEAFKDIAVTVTGDTPLKVRQKNIDAFQRSEHTRLFIGNMIAAGVGITLTASSHVVFAELSWVPGEVQQAEDRCHRIGQHDSVLVQHLVYAGSIDAIMAKTIVHKQDVIDQALDIKKIDDELKQMLA